MKQYSLLSIPVIYSAFMLYKTPTLGDSFILLGLCGVVGLFQYLSLRYARIPANSERSKLEEEMQIERLKLSISQMKEGVVRDKALRDARAATSGFQDGKSIRF